MSFPHGHLRADPDVKLRKVMHPAGPGAQIMDAAYPGMMSCRLNETLPPFKRPFLVHELIHGAAGRAKGVPRQPERNAGYEQGVWAGKPKKIGRAPGRERGGKKLEVSGVAGQIKKK